MKKILIIILLVLAVNLPAPAPYGAGPAWAAVDLSYIGSGARAMGMGKTGVSIFNDIHGLFINPAEISDTETPQFISLYTNILGEVKYMMAGASYPTRLGTLAVGYIGAEVGDIPLTRTDINGNLDYGNIGFTTYGNREFSLAYGADLGKSADYEFNLGGRLKFVSENFSGGNASGYDLDLGIRGRLFSWLSLAAVEENLLPVKWGGAKTWNTGRVEPLPANTKLALGANFKEIGLNMELGAEKITLDNTQPVLWHLGGEWWCSTNLALRMGFDQEPIAGPNSQVNPTFGIGFNQAGFQFDYAYHPYSGVADNAAHFFSLSYVGARDTIPPEIKHKFVNGDIYRGSDLELGIKVSEPVSQFKATLPNGETVELKPNAKGLALLRWKVPADLPLGANQIELQAQDQKKNSTKILVPFEVQGREPKLEITEPKDKRIKTASDSIDIKGLASGGKIEINGEIMEVGDKLDINVKVPKIGLNRIIIKIVGESGEVEEKEILVLRTGGKK
jgi:hypothetical protein